LFNVGNIENYFVDFFVVVSETAKPKKRRNVMEIITYVDRVLKVQP